MFIVPCFIVLWMFAFLILKTYENPEPNIRRHWPTIKFEDFYQHSGDGNINENETELVETIDWITSKWIITETKVSVWPIITRIKMTKSVLSSPKPSSTKSTGSHSSRDFISEMISIINEQPTNTSQTDDSFISESLSRTSFMYPGPSSTITSFMYPGPSSTITSIMHPSPSSTINQLASTEIKTDSIYSSSFTSTSPTVSKYISLNNYSSDYLSTIRLESSLTSIISIENTPTQTINNLISPSFSKTPTLSSSLIIFSNSSVLKPQSDIYEISLTPTSIGAVTPVLVMSTTITICPQSMSNTDKPQGLDRPQELDKPSEQYLIRTGTVLNRTDVNEDYLANVSLIVEGKIRQIFIYALGKQLDSTRKKQERKLLQISEPNIKIKIWGINSDNKSQEMHIIYSVEQNGVLLPYEDASRALSNIDDNEFSKMIGMNVIAKAEPLIQHKVYSRNENNLTTVVLLSSSLVFTIILFVIIAVFVSMKYHSAKKRWLDSLSVESNRVVPDNSVHWRTVSTTTDLSLIDSEDSSEFQYVPFKSRTNKKTKLQKKKTQTASKAIQSNLEMIKEKVIPIGKIINQEIDTSHDIMSTNTSHDMSADTSHNIMSADTSHGIVTKEMSHEIVTIDTGHDITKDNSHDIMTSMGKTTYYVTTKDIQTTSNHTQDIQQPTVPAVIQVHISEQTQSIIKAIRNELKKFSHHSEKVLPKKSSIEESISDESTSDSSQG